MGILDVIKHTLTQTDSHDETRDIPVDLGTFLSTVLRIWAGPTHTPVQITLIILPQFHHHISYFKVDSHSFKSCVSSLLSNHCQSSVNDSQTKNVLEVQYSSKNYAAKRCPLPLCTSFSPHFCPSSPIFYKKTYVVLGHGVVRRSKPTTHIATSRTFWYSTRASS